MRGSHIRMPQPSGNAGNGNTRKEQQRSVGVAQAMNSDDRDPSISAMPRQAVIYRRVIDLSLDKNWLIVRQIPQQFRKLNHRLPVYWNLANGRLVFSGEKTAIALVIPRFRHKKRLMRQIKILWRQR